MRLDAYKPLFTQLPLTRQERWDRLAEFVAFWHGLDCYVIDGALRTPQFETGLHVALPTALIEWHARFGRFFNLYSLREFTLPIDRLYIDDGLLVVRSELVFEGKLEAKWGVLLNEIEDDDPRVVCRLHRRIHVCANSVSEFAIFCALFDTTTARLFDEIDCDNDFPFPVDGSKSHFPPSFGIIETEVYEGLGWIALVSGRDWYLRRRDRRSAIEHFVKHEVRTSRLPKP